MRYDDKPENKMTRNTFYGHVALIKIVVLTGLCSLMACNTITEGNIEEQMEKGMAEVLRHISLPEIPAYSIDLMEFSGKEPDSLATHDFQHDIARAIDQLAERGGGSLAFGYPKGHTTREKPVLVYRIKGPITLKNNIGISIDRSIKLQFEFDPPSYRPNGKGVLSRYEGTMVYTHSPLIRGFNCENISITAKDGTGPLPVIDGDGRRWREWEVQGNEKLGNGGQNGQLASYMQVKEMNNSSVPINQRRMDTAFLRPPLIQFLLCKKVMVQDVKLVNSPFWTVHPLFSENLVFRGLEFEALVPNNDGIDPESSRYVLIENIKFNNADDNVAIKSGRDLEGREGAAIAQMELLGVTSPFIKNGRIGGATQHVLIRNCEFKGHYAICIGSEMSGGANHIYVDNKRATEEVSMGIYIKGGRNRGGTISHVYIKDMELNKVKNEVVRLLPNYDGDTQSPFPSKFHTIYLQNIEVKAAGKGILINGWPDQTIDSVYLNNVNIDEIKQETALQLNHIKGAVLKNVTLEGVSVDGLYDLSDDAKPIPR